VASRLPSDSDVEPVELAEGDELTVFRVVRTDDKEAPEFLESFRSHAELGLPPRSAEETHPLIHKGISVFDSCEAAVETARRYPKIGSHVAQLRLTGESGVRYWRWGARGHLTLWGDSLKLVDAVVDTIPIDGAL
jgi:hypothetical protein